MLENVYHLYENSIPLNELSTFRKNQLQEIYCSAITRAAVLKCYQKGLSIELLSQVKFSLIEELVHANDKFTKVNWIDIIYSPGDKLEALTSQSSKKLYQEFLITPRDFPAFTALNIYQILLITNENILDSYEQGGVLPKDLFQLNYYQLKSIIARPKTLKNQLITKRDLSNFINTHYSNIAYLAEVCCEKNMNLQDLIKATTKGEFVNQHIGLNNIINEFLSVEFSNIIKKHSTKNTLSRELADFVEKITNPQDANNPEHCKFQKDIYNLLKHNNWLDEDLCSTQDLSTILKFIHEYQNILMRKILDRAGLQNIESINDLEKLHPHHLRDLWVEKKYCLTSALYIKINTQKINRYFFKNVGTEIKPQKIDNPLVKKVILICPASEIIFTYLNKHDMSKLIVAMKKKQNTNDLANDDLNQLTLDNTEHIDIIGHHQVKIDHNLGV